MTKLWRALAVGAAGALIIGVAVAFAGVPHLSIATGDVSAGTTCTRKCTAPTTTLAKTADATAAAAGAGTTVIPATVTISWSGSQMSKSDNVLGSLQGTAKWACFNGGSNIPAETNNQKAAQTVRFSASSDLTHPSKSGNASGTIQIVNPGLGQTTLACQGTQVIALYSLQLASAPSGGNTFTFQVTATSDQGSDVIPVTLANPPFAGHPEWLYCRDGNTAACFS
jgi:hypothetical protein